MRLKLTQLALSSGMEAFTRLYLIIRRKGEKMILKKGQITVEYIVLVAFVLASAAILFGYVSTLTSESIDLQKVNDAVKTIGNAVNRVNSAGAGTKITVRIELPEGITGQIAQGNAFGYNISSVGGTSDIIFNADTNVIGELPLTAGINFVTVEALDSGAVRISSGLAASPLSVTKFLRPGQGSSQDFNLTNSSSIALTGISAKISGAISSFTTITQQPASGLAAGASTTLSAGFSIPGTQAAGIYHGTIDVNNAESISEIIFIRIIVEHVLNDVKVIIYSDSTHSTYGTSFDRNDTVYYKIVLLDQNIYLTETNDLNVRVKKPGGTTVETLSGKTATNGEFKGNYMVDDTTGTWTVEADANKFNTVSDSNSFTVS